MPTESRSEQSVAKPSERRRRLLIDRPFQLRFIGRLGGVLFFYLLLFLLISVAAPIAFTFLGDPPEWAVMETAYRVEVLARLILAPLFCTFLCLFAHGILETFRIAGPNYRFKAVLRDLQRLRVPSGVRVRRGDYLRDTALEFDRALSMLHGQLKSLRQDSQNAVAAMKRALGNASGDPAREAMAAVALVDQELQQFELVGPAPSSQNADDRTMANSPPVEPMTNDVEATITAAR